MTDWNDASLVKPDDGDLVIVCEGNSTWYGYYNSQTGRWGDDNFTSNMQVTHWMPFPEPPTNP